MNRDVIRARELLAQGACEDVEKLKSTSNEDPEADRLAERIKRAIRMLERVPAEAID